ncbi:type II toxin-antitoxin system VapC family toxin [Methanocalculus chunghsingensis]|nr:type II toxin-antitoxin system VapC family toxin [Methanocalculus chunghsingensis]
MMLIDSNIIIYAMKPEHEELRLIIDKTAPYVSAVSYVEVLGYHKLKEDEKHCIRDFFRASLILPISQKVQDKAVFLRQQRRMTLGDALIAGTALVFDLKLVTRNIGDFQWIDDLTLINPFDESSNTWQSMDLD